MNILFLSLYFEPDLCAGSFRNTTLFRLMIQMMGSNDHIDVITSLPNRYASFSIDAKEVEKGDTYTIHRIRMPKHDGAMIDQVKSYSVYFRNAILLTKQYKYDLVYASSSRLFTAVLGSYLARKNNCPLYLDIRDIFSDSFRDYFKGKPYIRWFGLYPILQFEKYAFNRAQHINIVSEGFANYFKRYPQAVYSFFTNGIDDVFIENAHSTIYDVHLPLIVTYAGNIGQGQELDKMIPQLARELGEDYLFRIIGDGGTKNLLEEELQKLSVTNVQLIKPVSRTELLRYYDETDFFFTKLNPVEKVALPSKIFEYGAYDKPIICALSGFANEFVRKNVSNIILSEADDVNTLAKEIRSYKYRNEDRKGFKQRFARTSIMKEMAMNVLSLLS